MSVRKSVEDVREAYFTLCEEGVYSSEENTYEHGWIDALTWVLILFDREAEKAKPQEVKP